MSVSVYACVTAFHCYATLYCALGVHNVCVSVLLASTAAVQGVSCTKNSDKLNQFAVWLRFANRIEKKQ